MLWWERAGTFCLSVPPHVCPYPAALRSAALTAPGASILNPPASPYSFTLWMLYFSRWSPLCNEGATLSRGEGGTTRFQVFNKPFLAAPRGVTAPLRVWDRVVNEIQRALIWTRLLVFCDTR